MKYDPKQVEISQHPIFGLHLVEIERKQTGVHVYNIDVKNRTEENSSKDKYVAGQKRMQH